MSAAVHSLWLSLGNIREMKLQTLIPVFSFLLVFFGFFFLLGFLVLCFLILVYVTLFLMEFVNVHWLLM